MPEPTLEELSAALSARLEAVLPVWLERLVAGRLAQAGIQPTAEERIVIRALCSDTGARMGQAADLAIRADVDDGAGSPLDVIRRRLGPVNDYLTDAGAPERPRDDFARRHFPNDTHDLAPANFGDIDPSLQEPGVLWGAARAYVHLSRRADTQGEANRRGDTGA